MISPDAYRAARESAAVIDRSDRVRIEFTGAQAAATLNGILTNDVALLTPGRGQYAAALTAKGKVIADVRVFARDGDFLVDAAAAAGPPLLAMLRKFVNPRLAKFRDVSSELGTVGVFGPGAAGVVAGICGVDAAALTVLESFAAMPAGFHASPCTIVRVPDLGVAGFDLFVPIDRVAALVSALRAAGATALDALSADVLRIEAGRPLWGTDMDENTLAQEAALDRKDLGAISFDKGCYTGQETVARVHFRGHVNRVLRGLRCAALPPSGAVVTHAENRDAGTVRSVAVSPRLGALALAYVRREVEDGAAVTLRWDGGEVRATVSPLPFD
jgi:folate-binding protein YgfZ